MQLIHIQSDSGTQTEPSGTRVAGRPILEIKDLATHYFLDDGVVRAVDDVTLILPRGGTLGIVGESGSGKSVTARSILQIVGAGGRIVKGQILFDRGVDVLDLAALKPTDPLFREVRWGSIAMIFQEPMAAFSPVYTIGRQIIEAVTVHKGMSRRAARARAVEVVDWAGIPQASRTIDRYPFELSGGMLQRAMIAMALSCEPAVLIADEPTTALDVTIQGQILELLRNLQRETDMSIILISHDMGVIAELAESVAVMYLGRVVEQALVWDIFDRPAHPYTKALLESVPTVGDLPEGGRLKAVRGNIPNPYSMPHGCRFHPRCDFFMAGVCDLRDPPSVELDPTHYAACFVAGGDLG